MTHRIRDRVEFSSYEPAETTIFVDPVAGDDGNDGYLQPLATIQEAIYRFIPPYAPAPYWARDEVYTINVLYTPGMSTITEAIHIPVHRGDGTLHIAAQEAVEFSGLLQSGAASQGGVSDPDGYFHSHWQITTTTSPMTASTLGDGYFIRQTTNINEHPSEVYYDNAVIIDNGTNTLDLVMHQLGSFFGFAYANNMEFDIVQPQIQWSHPNDQQVSFAFVNGPLITAEGGVNLITGFKFNTVGRNRVFVNGKGLPGNSETKSSTVLARCIFDITEPFFNIASGSGITLAANFITVNQVLLWIFNTAYGCELLNTRLISVYTSSNTVIRLAESSNSVQIYGISYDGNGLSQSFGVNVWYSSGIDVQSLDIRSAAGGLSFFSNKSISLSRFSIVNSFSTTALMFTSTDAVMYSNVSIIISDNDPITIRTTSNLTMQGSSVLIEGAEENGIGVYENSALNIFTGVTINGSTNSGIKVINSIVQGANLVGTGNGDYGIELGIGAKAILTGTNTITGGSGDALVGTSPHSFGATATTTDASKLSILDEA